MLWIWSSRGHTFYIRLAAEIDDESIDTSVLCTHIRETVLIILQYAYRKIPRALLR